jgi:hypothetical protein
MYQFRWRSECRPSLSVISAAFMALGRSYEAINSPFISAALCFTVIRGPTKNIGTLLYSLVLLFDRDYLAPKVIYWQACRTRKMSKIKEWARKTHSWRYNKQPIRLGHVGLIQWLGLDQTPTLKRCGGGTGESCKHRHACTRSWGLLDYILYSYTTIYILYGYALVTIRPKTAEMYILK